MIGIHVPFMFTYAIYILGAGDQNPFFSHTAHRHQRFLVHKNVRPSIFIVDSTDAFTGLKLLHLPLHATDSYKWAQGG